MVSGYTVKNLKVKWHGSLQFRLFLIFFISMVALSTAIVWVVQNSVQERVYSSSRNYMIEKGYSVANRIDQQISYIEGIAQSISRVASVAPLDADLMHQIIPELLESTAPNSIIAGGGVWPEPYAFDPDTQRYSFFWGRQEGGALAFYNDYNLDEGRGYHNEEWYVPARHYRDGVAYWSQSYTDPYSLEPMVTCTCPYYREGVFRGVITVDVKLEGLYSIFEDEAKAFSGYIFAVDRNNRFLSYPNKESVKPVSGANAKDAVTYLTAFEMSAREVRFQQFSDAFEGLDKASHGGAGSEQIDELAALIAAQSYQIDLKYGRLIAKEALGERHDDQLHYDLDFINNDDPVLGGASFNLVYDLPSTHWKLAVVAPLDLLILPTKEFVDVLVTPLLLIIFACLFGMLLVTHMTIITPVRKVTRQISDLNEHEDVDNHIIHYPFRDELGMLVNRFNCRTQSLFHAREQAESALVAKRNFIANISHEIRTPMNGILLSAEILTQKDLPQECMQYAQVIEQSSNALLTIINEILDYSKLESKKIKLENVDFSLPRLIGEATELFKASADLKDIDYQIIYATGMPECFHADSTRLRQIVLNLVGNAIKFTDSGYIRIEMDYKVSQETLTIEVSDSGIGIAPDQLERIFEDFAQGDTSTTRVFGGTGLGLSICRKLIILMGGAIHVESTLGKGSCFALSVPMPVATQTLPSVETSSPVRKSRVGAFSGRLLLVEDNLVNQKLEQHLFKRLGFEVTLVDDGQQAVDACYREPFDIVFMDLQMPVLDGLSATKQIRAMDHPNKDVIIVALSASVGQESKDECIQCGMQGFLGKPVSLVKLMEELHRLLQPTDPHSSSSEG